MKSRFFGLVPSAVVDAALAAVCFFVLYGAVTSFEPSIALYDATLANQILLVAMLMLLPLVFLGIRPLDLRADGGAWLAIAVVMIVSTVLADHYAAAEKLRLVFACLAFGLALRTGLEYAGDRAVAAILFAVCLFHVPILMLVIQHVPSADALWPSDSSWVPYHANIRHVAYHGMVASCAGITLGFLQPSLRFPGFVLATMALAGTFFFGARGALLGWLVFVAVFALSSRRYRLVLVSAGLVAAVALVMAMVVESFYVSPPFGISLRGRMESASGLFNTAGRIQIWLDALQFSRQHPWFGHGMDAYRISGCCMAGTVQPHNMLVQWLMEFGVIGTSAVLWALWRIIGTRLVPSLRGGNANLAQAALLSVIAGILAFGLVDGVFYHAVPLLVFSILCTLLCWTARKSGGETLRDGVRLPASREMTANRRYRRFNSPSG